MNDAQWDTYTTGELDEMVRREESEIKSDRWAAEGNGLRAEIARSHVRTREANIRAIRAALQRKGIR